MGYCENGNDVAETATTPSVSAKRIRQSLIGTEADWHYLQLTEKRKLISGHLNQILNFKKEVSTAKNSDTNCDYQVNRNAVLFPFIKIIHFILHLVYEDLKLNMMYKKDIPLLAKLLTRLSFELNLKEYQLYYFKEFPEYYATKNTCLSLDDLKDCAAPQCIGETPPSVTQLLLGLLERKPVKALPVMQNVNTLTRNVVEICSLYLTGCDNLDGLICNIAPISLKCESNENSKKKITDLTGNKHEMVVSLMAELGIKSCNLNSFPIGIKLLLHNALWLCREQPPMNWNFDTYKLLSRMDLANQINPNLTVIPLLSHLN